MPILPDRRTLLSASALAALGMLGIWPQPAKANALQDFLNGLRATAIAAGVDAGVFDTIVGELVLDEAVIAQSRKQSEFTRPFWDYVEGAVSPARLKQGKLAIAKARGAFGWVETNLGVGRSVIAGIWGMESNFGAAMGDKDVLRSTASLAFSGYRADFYANEFIAALRILGEGHIPRAGMIGSWAGAMGQTQFIPSSFLKYATDADGDGRKNIWTSTSDALASAGNHLAMDGWIKGLPWGFEVLVPEDFNFAFGDRMTRHPFQTLVAEGLKRPGTAKWPASGSGSLFLPTGMSGPAFVITDNFEVIRQYNTSDAYALGVGLLGDRLFGAPALTGRWPKSVPQLQSKGLAELQQRLKDRGLPITKIDGKLGWQTRQAVQAVQKQLGLVPDGHPDVAFLDMLRQK